MNDNEKQALHAWTAIVQTLEYIAKKYKCELRFTHGGKVVQFFNEKGGYAMSIESLKRGILEHIDLLDFIETQVKLGNIFGYGAYEEEA